MYRFIVIGHRTITSGDFSLDDICGSAGRLDILVRCINSSFFLSHELRQEIELLLILQGKPSPPRTIRFVGHELKYLNPDERSTAALVRNALLKTGDKEFMSTPGIYVSKRGFGDVLGEYRGSQLVYLTEGGEDIREIEFGEEATLVLSDDQNLTGDEEKVLRDFGAREVSVGPQSLHTDHCIILVLNELDRQKKRGG